MSLIIFMESVKYLVGIDEVGRGPIAGPVTVCAFLVKNDDRTLTTVGKFLLRDKRGGFKDSKRLSKNQREICFAEIKKARNGKIKCGFDFAVSFVDHNTIDRKGIVEAINLAIERSLHKLTLAPSETRVFLDGGLKAPNEFKNQKTIIKGDQKIPVIALASIVAKVSRDRKMHLLAKKYQDYGFENHVGYGTTAHYTAIKKLGLCEIHRRTFLKQEKCEIIISN